MPLNNRMKGLQKLQWKKTGYRLFFASAGTTTKDFEEVCSNAGVDPDYMRDFAYKVLKSGELDYVRKRINAVLGH